MSWFAVTLAACSSTSAPRWVRAERLDTPLDDPAASATATTPTPTPTATEPLPPAVDPPCSVAAAIVLNEVSPSNRTTLVDLDGESVDWLELTNADAVPLDLAGWTLSDDPDEPGKWAFPAVVVEPGALLLVHASGKDRARVVGAWDTRIDQGHEWSYLPASSTVPGWYLPDYDATDWETGPSGFGEGDSDDETRVDADTIYVRTELELTAADLAELVAMALHVDYDDGFAAYLNGVEVVRVGLGIPGSDPPAWDASADDGHEATLYQGEPPAYFDLDASIGLLHEGANTLALEVHDDGPDSSDLTLVPFLSLGFSTSRDVSAAAALGLPLVDLHTNFSLRASGEAVRLFDPSGCESDVLDPEPLRADESYGRQPDGTGALGYFMEPTPGAANLTEARPGFAATPTFDPPPGYYAGGTDVTVLASAGARVHVAWEGWEPTEDDPEYVAPLPTGASGEPVVLRARSWEDDLWPSRIATSTWLLDEPGTLPIVSLVTDPPNLWDDEIGIYAIGADADPEFPYQGAHFKEKWERAVHAEQWEPDGSLGFSVDGAIAIQGGSSRNYEQKNLEVTLGNGWGDDAIEHRVFPDLDLTSFTRLVLRAGGSDWLGCFGEGCLGGTLSRDRLMSAISVGADLDRMAARPAEVYLNGEYWGIYFLNEKADLAYVEGHHGTDDVDILRNEVIARTGDATSYLELLEWLRANDLADPANYAHVQTLIDVDELQTYLIFEIYYANTDWPGNNIEYWRPRTPDGRWRWMMFGTDFGLGLRNPPGQDTLAAALEPDGDGWPNPAWSTELFRLLVQSPEFTHSFVNRYADYLNTLLLPERTQALNRELADEIASEVPRHVERWGSWTEGDTSCSLDGDEWEQAVDYVDWWLEDRPDHAREHLVENFGFAGTWTLTLEADPPGSGTFALTAVTVEGPFTGTYFEGVPVTVTAVPAAGYTFAEWSDPTLPGVPDVTIDGPLPSPLTARFQ